jgi:hypothetical protein
MTPIDKQEWLRLADEGLKIAQSAERGSAK